MLAGVWDQIRKPRQARQPSIILQWLLYLDLASLLYYDRLWDYFHY